MITVRAVPSSEVFGRFWDAVNPLMNPVQRLLDAGPSWSADGMPRCIV